MRVRQQYFTDGVITETKWGIIIELTDGTYSVWNRISHDMLWYASNPNHMILYKIEYLQEWLKGGSR